ncbi:MAG: transposase [Acidobacteria bacterium]|nr:transposase [Acidobacteriota bacterium]
MWNDTDEPIAYLITFRTYGTWLHGDERGSTDRNNNQYGEPFIPKNECWFEHNKNLLRSEPFKLDVRCRRVVATAIREVCDHYSWQLAAMDVRTNHAHSVIQCPEHSSRKALRQFKAFSTRRLRETGLWAHDHSPWAEKGSRRLIWNEAGFAAAVNYVKNRQGGPLPDLGS